MSTKYPGGFITKSPVAPTTTAASGVWTLDQQEQLKKAGTWPAPPVYIEDVFSTYLYTGNSSTQTITNGINLSSNGGLIWRQGRSAGTGGGLIDTTRGIASYLNTSTADAASTGTNWITSFNTDGFTMNSSSFNGGATYASWTFQEQPKFFDIVAATNTGGTNARISHNLGSVPGFVIVKSTDYYSESWRCYHRSLGRNSAMQLNLTDGVFTYTNYWGTSDPTSTDFGINWTLFSGTNYIFYFFAHDAGGFGLTGTDNVISCGSYTGNGSTSGPEVTLGYEPQFVMIKAAQNVRTSPTSYNNWAMVDVMRGMPNPTVGTGYALAANLSDAENGGYLSGNSTVYPTATGFKINSNESMYNYNGCTYIYIAIRRGPMKTPTTGTSVFNPVSATSTAPAFQSSNFNAGVDTSWVYYTPGYNDGTNAYPNLQTRLTGTGQLQTPNTRNEVTQSYNTWGYMNGQNSTSGLSTEWGSWMFKRAPGFHDVVCYTGNGIGQTIYHNLGVAPELMIFKTRTGSLRNWGVYAASVGTGKKLWLNATNAVQNDAAFVPSTPTATILNQGNADETDEGGNTYVAYLFATCPGVSKVGSYTGTGTTKQIDCGFTGGARFVMIKRTNSTGGWYVWDSNRGIVSGNDPYILINTYDAEATGTDYVDTYSAGFEISSTAPAEINANGGTFIFLAIA